MPPGKDRSKDDTWKESELKKALQGDKKKSRDDRKPKESSSSRRDDDRRERRDRDEDKRRRERHKEVENGESGHRDREKERRHDDAGRERTRDKDRDRERERDKPRDKDREKRREREGDRDRSRDRERRKDGETERSRDKEREGRRGREGDERSRDKERERRRDRDGDTERRKDKERERRRETDDKEREKRKERHGEGSKEKERQKERDGNRERTGEHSSDKRKDRERRHGEENDRGRDKSRDRERHRDREGERSKGDRERHDKRRKERGEEEGKDSDRDERRRHRERREPERHDRKGRDEDEHRRRSRKDAPEAGETEASEKVKQREKELMDSLKREEDKSSKKRDAMKFRSDTVEEADTVEEEALKQRRRSSVAVADEVNDEDPGGDDYEDDFEDYEEDFEKDDEENSEEDNAPPNAKDKAGLQELLQAINAENEDVKSYSREGSGRKQRSSDEDWSEPRQEKSPRPTTSKGRINFSAAKQKQLSEKVASRTKKRGQELMRLIDLDVAAFDIFELPPLGEYELYIKNFGRSDTKQAYVQCNEDNVEREVQTEEIEQKTVWTQEPALGLSACGDEEQEGDFSSMADRASIDSLRLSKFLEKAGQTFLQLLEESSQNVNTMFREKTDVSCSEGFIKLGTKQPFLEGRAVQCVHVSPVQTHLLMTAYGPVERKAVSEGSKVLQSKSVVCVWNINEPAKPQKVLLCESIPKCCSFSPSKATLAFAGLADGSLVAWDLREQSSLHRSIQVGNDVEFRTPTFSTAGILREDSHHSPVKSLLPIVVPGDSAKASEGTGNLSDDMLGLSFQLASLEENGIINIWVVVELDRIDVSGSESDLGLAPGGRVKLIKSSSLSLASPYRDFRKATKIQAFTMCFLPQDPNHIYIGTDGGYVLHCVRHGGRSPPKAYRPSVESVVDVRTVDVSPWNLPCILAGSDDGSLRLYNLKNETPLSTWSEFAGGSAILCVQWSRSRPSVLYALDANSRLHVWDLLVNDSEPVATEKFKHGRVTHFELSSDYSASGVGLPGRSPELVLVYDNGTVEVHKVSARFATSSADELDRFSTYLDNVLS